MWRPVLSFNNGEICEMTYRKQELPVEITPVICSSTLSHILIIKLSNFTMPHLKFVECDVLPSNN